MSGLSVLFGLRRRNSSVGLSFNSLDVFVLIMNVVHLCRKFGSGLIRPACIRSSKLDRSVPVIKSVSISCTYLF